MSWPVLSFLFIVVACTIAPAAAVEIPLRISDREIIQSLVELKAGQQTLQEHLDEVKKQIAELRQSTHQQITELRQSSHQQIGELRQSTHQQVSDLRQDMHQRFNDVMTLLQILIGLLALILGGMFAWLAVGTGGRTTAGIRGPRRPAQVLA
ncbi:MAG: hypothetical protein NZ578_15800 [Candidatus Binatia bacterium]|nr:hypothetical protein [Candidatus Binatia bacterium]